MWWPELEFVLKGVARADKAELGGSKANFGRSVVNQARIKNSMRNIFVHHGIITICESDYYKKG